MTVSEQTRIATGLVAVQDAMTSVAALMYEQGGEYAEHAAELLGARNVISTWLNGMDKSQCTYCWAAKWCKLKEGER